MEKQEVAWAKYVRERYDPHHGRDDQGFIDIAKYIRRVNWSDELYELEDRQVYRDITYCWYADYRVVIKVVVRVCPAQVDRSTITYFEVFRPYRHYQFATQALDYVLRDQKVKYAVVYRGDDTLLEFYRKHGKFYRPLPKTLRERFFPPRKIILERKVGHVL